MKKNTLIRLMIFCLIAFSLNSCQLLGKVLFGMRSKVYWMEPKDVHSYFDKFDIPANQRFELDTASYYKAEVQEYRLQLEALDSLDSLEQKKERKILNDNLQPNQIRFFNAQGDPIFKMVNCYIDPPLPVSWNKHGSFDAFPPTIDFMQSGEGNKPLSHFLKHTHTLDQKAVNKHDLPKAGYYAMVINNDLMKRVSRRQMRTMKKYLKEHQEENIHVLYVNNNNHELWSLFKDQGIDLQKELEKEKNKAP